MERIFSDLTRRVQKFWSRLFSRKSLTIIATFYSYEDITLKLFVTINASGNFRLLIKSGIALPSECFDRWEKIIQENNRAAGRHEYSTFLKTYKAYNRLLAEFNSIKAHLLILCYVIDYEAIKFVRKKGYAIALTNSKAYADSIYSAIRRSDNLLTKISMKRNELLKMQPKGDARQESFESIIANLTVELGYSIPDDITLARYNEYVKIIERKHLAMKAAHEKQKSYGR